MVFIGTNATGWTNLTDAHLIKAAYEVYYASGLTNWVVVILFAVYQFLLIIKTRNLALSFFSSLLFGGLFLFIEGFFNPSALWVIALFFVIQVVVIMYVWV